MAMFAIALALAAAPASFTADQLVAKNLEARGGAAALKAIESIQFEGTYLTPGDFELKFKQTQKRQPGGDAMRLDLTVQGLTIVQSYDGKAGWKINPFQGRRDAETMSTDEARSLAHSAMLTGARRSPAANRAKVTYMGREDFDGTDTYKLRVTQPDGDEFTYFLDPDTFLEIKMVESRRVRGTLSVSDAEFGDYEKIAGVYFPMSIEQWPDGSPNARSRLTLDKGSANVAIPDGYFSQPGTPAKPARGGGQ